MEPVIGKPLMSLMKQRHGAELPWQAHVVLEKFQFKVQRWNERRIDNLTSAQVVTAWSADPV
jgi:hypothetical protein